MFLLAEDLLPLIEPELDKMKHEKFKYRIITFFEMIFNGGRDFVGYTNWNIVKLSEKK